MLVEWPDTGYTSWTRVVDTDRIMFRASSLLISLSAGRFR